MKPKRTVKRTASAGSSPHPVDVHVGSRIRALRLDRGLSQSALGDAVGVSFQQIQKYERGSNRVSASMLYRIAGVLGTEVQALFEGCGPVPD